MMSVSSFARKPSTIRRSTPSSVGQVYSYRLSRGLSVAATTVRYCFIEFESPGDPLFRKRIVLHTAGGPLCSTVEGYEDAQRAAFLRSRRVPLRSNLMSYMNSATEHFSRLFAGIMGFGVPSFYLMGCNCFKTLSKPRKRRSLGINANKDWGTVSKM